MELLELCIYSRTACICSLVANLPQTKTLSRTALEYAALALALASHTSLHPPGSHHLYRVYILLHLIVPAVIYITNLRISSFLNCDGVDS